MGFLRVEITPQATKRVSNHDCWVFRPELARKTPILPAGEVVEVVDHRGGFVAYAFYSASSHIALRIVSTAQDAPVDRALLHARVAEALSRRAAVSGTTARRLVYSEADGLPGLIVDQYGVHLVAQFRSAGMDRLRPMVVDLLNELVHPGGILERSDKEFREEEGLPAVTQVLTGTVPNRLRIEEDGLTFVVDPYRGLKTGFYLDQRPTRQRLRQLVGADERVLDAFSYTGSCAVAAATRGARVVCVEQDEPFLELAKENATLNRVEDRIEFVPANAFYWLQMKAGSGARCDWVLLDPPALAKSKAEVLKGRQALHHLLVQALALLDGRGRLLLSVCTYHLLGLVEEIVRIAAATHGMRLRVRDQWGQAEDHPWILQMPATRYLTTWLLEPFDFAPRPAKRTSRGGQDSGEVVSYVEP